MYPSSLCRLMLAAVLFVFSLSTSVMAASVSVVPSGAASYVIQGNLDGVAGIELNISYDTSMFQGTPTVKQESLVSGAMLAANTSRPGSIKIAIISTKAFSGSGPIASITFASKSASAPLPTVTANMIDSKGSPIGSATGNAPIEAADPRTITTPGVPFSQPPATATTPATTPAVPQATTTIPGTVTLPAEQQQQAESQPAPNPPVPANTGEPAAAVTAEQTQPAAKPATDSKPAADSKPEETPQYVVYKGILERFKQYNGSKQLSFMVALFDKKVAQTINQEPAILLSDGQNKATLTVDIPVRIKSSPNFAVNGGKLVSFEQDKQSKGRWIVVVQPEAGVIRASVTIITGAEEFEYPLTVAQQIKTTLTLDERGWNRFLKEVGTATAPLHDLNNDGVRDYMDEFIFVANHLAGKSTTAKPASTSKKSVK